MEDIPLWLGICPYYHHLHPTYSLTPRPQVRAFTLPYLPADYQCNYYILVLHLRNEYSP